MYLKNLPTRHYEMEKWTRKNQKNKNKKQKITSLLLIELQQKMERNKATGSSSNFKLQVNDLNLRPQAD